MTFFFIHGSANWLYHRYGCMNGCAVWCNNNKHHKKEKNKSHCFLIFDFSLMDEFENHCHLPGAGLGRRNSAPSSSLAEQLSHSRLGTRRKSTDDRYAIVGICAMAKKVSVRSGDCSPAHYKYSQGLCTFWDRGSAFTLLYLHTESTPGSQLKKHFINIPFYLLHWMNSWLR